MKYSSLYNKISVENSGLFHSNTPQQAAGCAFATLILKSVLIKKI